MNLYGIKTADRRHCKAADRCKAAAAERLLLRSIAVHCRLLPLIAVLRLLIALLCLIWLLVILPVVGLLLPVVAVLRRLLLIGYIDIVPLLLPVVGLLLAVVAVLRLLLIILWLSVALRLGEVAVLRLHRPGAPLVAVAVGVILHLHRADHRDELPFVEIPAHEVGSLPPRVHIEEVGDPLAVLSRIIPLHGKREFCKRHAALGCPVIRLGGEPSHQSNVVKHCSCSPSACAGNQRKALCSPSACAGNQRKALCGTVSWICHRFLLATSTARRGAVCR